MLHSTIRIFKIERNGGGGMVTHFNAPQVERGGRGGGYCVSFERILFNGHSFASGAIFWLGQFGHRAKKAPTWRTNCFVAPTSPVTVPPSSGVLVTADESCGSFFLSWRNSIDSADIQQPFPSGFPSLRRAPKLFDNPAIIRRISMNPRSFHQFSRIWAGQKPEFYDKPGSNNATRIINIDQNRQDFLKKKTFFT